jgi:hypothetical protein
MMNRSSPPVVLWGNTVILILLAAGALLLDRVRLTQYSEIPVVVKNMRLDGQGRCGGDLAIRYGHGAEDLKGRPIILQYPKGQSSVSETISGSVTAVEKGGPVQYTLTFLALSPMQTGRDVDLPDSGQVCTAKINTGSRSIFQMIRRQFSLLVGQH